MQATKPKRAKKPSRPVYFQVRRLVDPATGEEVGALVPRHRIDQRIMRERGYCVGNELRADLKKPRNSGFHRMVHSLGALAADHIEEFTGVDCHEVIKRLQRESGVCCEVQDIVLPGIGTIQVNVAKTIAYDEMDEGEFQALWKGICQHISDRYWPTMNQDQIAEMAKFMPEAV
ncbi:hypothetical protein BXT89_14385 [Halopseudomonas pachastrellae]|uniref:Uncharacterized protein n=1 Tax=Halopseudomonas pachastrellae TaxID=254161 RepID=A0A1S8DFE3_9GAMM|nr:hypothetical protein [Halopseudomonas pachastrellae]ONM43137.1 hypothetical protein BXT89_14385 [Halopseudomonas pachastrellae]